MVAREIQIAIDVGKRRHHVGIAGSDGSVLDEFEISHCQAGFHEFFTRVERRRGEEKLPVAVAMEGLNGHSRPLDRQIRERGYRLYNVNNLKLARFKEIFPGPAKSDSLDTRRMLELFHLKDHLPMAKGVLQPVYEVPEVNEKLKRLTRRRRQLVNEKTRVVNRIQADMQAVCPELLAITRSVENLWFLRFLTCRDELTKLARLQEKSMRKIRGIGRTYCQSIQGWQPEAHFSTEVAWVGPMILTDARRILELLEQIAGLEVMIAEVAQNSTMARRIATLKGFGRICSTELAGEIGTVARFDSEAGLALYLAMCPLVQQSGEHHGSKRPRQVNRRAKAAMMTAVARHIDQVPESRAYYDKKRAEGKTHNQAVRALGRHLVRVIWSMLTQERDYEVREVIHSS